MDLNKIRKDKSKIEAGQWVGSIPGMGRETRFRVRGITSASFTAYLDEQDRNASPDQRDRAGTVTPQAKLQIYLHGLAEVVLLDWEGIEIDGKPLPFSRETAVKYLTDPSLEDFAEKVAWAARVVDRGRGDVEGALEKN